MPDTTLDRDSLAFDSITALAARIRSGAVGPVALTEQLLDRAAALDPHFHAFIVLLRDRAMAEARAAEAALRSGRDLGPLHGIPFAVKDLFDVKEAATTAGTRVLSRNIAREDSEAVRRLSAAGMVLLGKTHTIQLAFGVIGINHDFGTPHNPWHREPHAPGGSSSGSGVAVASGMVPLALGTDTGGSIRVPAALCGAVGLKTTVGRVSRSGVHPLSWTLDSVGPLTRTVEDAATVFQSLQGEDPRDKETLGIPPVDTLRGLKDGVKGLRLAFAETLFFDDVDAEVEQAVRAAGEVFRGLGARVESMEVPEAAAAWSERKRPYLVNAEACVVNRDLLDNHFDELDPVVGPRMISGRKLAATDYFLLLRRFHQLRDEVQATLRDVDALLVPTVGMVAPPLASITPEDYVKLHFKLHRNVGIGNILNLCAVSLPCGFGAGGLPIGLMIYAKPFREDLALRVACAYESATEWHSRRPDLGWTG
ncbi:MAG: amidase [Candidatus Eisenbacteria bacterium]|nr:amidase [Candidatus Eisenbacteria bacterium]